MNKTEQAQQLRLAAELIKTGHPFAFQDGGEWVMAITITPDHAVCERREIRPILATPRDGRPLHNPDNLTAEQVGLGYRLGLQDESANQPHEVWGSDKLWRQTLKGMRAFGDYDFTYRLPLSVPWPEAKPDPYAELKAAHAAGKVIQAKAYGEWHDETWLAMKLEDFPISHLRIKPEPPPFQLPPPPPGMKWHREDGWKEGDLPQGYRPLVYNECRKNEDEWTYGDGNGWRLVANYGPEGEVGKGAARHRTTRPLIFTHEGKEWTYHRPGDPMPCDTVTNIDVIMDDGAICLCHYVEYASTWHQIIGWRYAETTKQVPLGPDDVPPGSVVLSSSAEANGMLWNTVTCSKDDGVEIYGRICIPWSELLSHWQINRSIPLTGKWDANAWEPCSKEVQA